MTLKGALSDRDGWSAANCTMAAALDVVGRRASMLLLREAFYGADRFGAACLRERRAHRRDHLSAAFKIDHRCSLAMRAATPLLRERHFAQHGEMAVARDDHDAVACTAGDGTSAPRSESPLMVPTS